MERVQFNGFSNIDPALLKRVQEIAHKEADKVENMFNEFTVELHLKEFMKTSGKAKYNINAHIKTPNKNYSSGVTEWDLVKSVHRALENVNKEITSDIRKEDMHKKPSERKLE